MRNQLLSLFTVALVVFTFSAQSHAQIKRSDFDLFDARRKTKIPEGVPVLGEIDGLKVLVSIENPMFRFAPQPKVKVALENKTGSTIYLRGGTSIGLYFERIGVIDSSCRRLDCFVGSAGLADAIIENNKSIEAEFFLPDLYWSDVTSSLINSKFPKNFFKTVTFGEYSFYATANLPQKASVFEKSKVVWLKSNKVKVSM